jgi:hypothetical protein
MLKRRIDIEAMHAFIDGEILSRDWNERILPLSIEYVGLWFKDNDTPDSIKAMSSAAVKLRLALSAAIVSAKRSLAEMENDKHHHTDFEGWLTSNGEDWGTRRVGHYEAYIAEFKNEHWLSIYHGNNRIMHTSCPNYYKATEFADTFLAGTLLDGKCFDVSHAKRRD